MNNDELLSKIEELFGTSHFEIPESLLSALKMRAEGDPTPRLSMQHCQDCGTQMNEHYEGGNWITVYTCPKCGLVLREEHGDFGSCNVTVTRKPKVRVPTGEYEVFCRFKVKAESAEEAREILTGQLFDSPQFFDLMESSCTESDALYEEE